MSTISELRAELHSLEGLHGQHPESGAGIDSKASYLREYTTKLFGAPFQFLDSVDRRFPSINSYVGNEYLRNFMLNSPILHIKPGMPKYTGGKDTTSITEGLKSMYMDRTQGDFSMLRSMMDQFASTAIFGGGSKLQKRMFGFRETYYDYMQHVNYMCRSMAVFLGLTESEKFPNGTFITGWKMDPFATMRWENYRMMANSRVPKPTEYLGDLLGAATDDMRDTVNGILGSIGNGIKGIVEMPSSIMDAILNGGNPVDSLAQTGKDIVASWDYAGNVAMSDVMADKISSVEFMVEPIQFTDSLNNNTEPSMLESTLDAISQGVGAEVAFITNSDADIGLIDNLMGMLGDTVSTAATALNGVVGSVGGGFTANLFSGALQSIKGQKMIYPEIYKSSKSQTDYQFSVTLTTPYGDMYNYYMNIIVPLMHLIALTAPRMVTSNTVTSPYMVQAYIPGMCTCQLGVISQMTIQKNPSRKHVSVHGFPLTVTVEFTIKELYNALSISPANDPASFLFNETLNDYMANLAGLAPSIDTYTKQRANAFTNMEQYLKSGEYVEDVAGRFTPGLEDFVNPFVGR